VTARIAVSPREIIAVLILVFAILIIISFQNFIVCANISQTQLLYHENLTMSRVYFHEKIRKTPPRFLLGGSVFSCGE
jgi:hypothetical protein